MSGLTGSSVSHKKMAPQEVATWKLEQRKKAIRLEEPIATGLYQKNVRIN